MISPPCDSPEQRGRRAATGAVAQVRPAVVVELQVPIQRGLQESDVREEPTAELHAPQLGKDGALQAFDEAIGPGVAGPGAGMPNAPGGIGLVEGPSVLAAPVGEHPPERPAGCLVDREHPRGEEARRRLGGALGGDLGDGVRAGRIAGGVLPSLKARAASSCKSRVPVHRLFPRSRRSHLFAV
jgi:hypothetical protein